MIPFHNQPMKLYSRAVISALPDNLTGVYGLYKYGQWIYIGKGNIKERMLGHLDGDNPDITRLGPTHWLCELTRNPDKLYDRLIEELNPAGNIL